MDRSQKNVINNSRNSNHKLRDGVRSENLERRAEILPPSWYRKNYNLPKYAPLPPSFHLPYRLSYSQCYYYFTKEILKRCLIVFLFFSFCSEPLSFFSWWNISAQRSKIKNLYNRDELKLRQLYFIFWNFFVVPFLVNYEWV